MPDLLQALRAGTRSLHDRLDGAELSVRITDGTLDAADYVSLIDWQHRAHAVAEAGLMEVLWPEGYKYIARLPVLSEEAARLGLPAPVVEALAPPVSLAAATGRAYVFEGSSLGGNLIVGHLQQNAQLTALQPFAYYAFQRTYGLGQWRLFAAFAKTRSWSDAEVDEAVVEAKGVFEVFSEMGASAH